MTSFLGVPLRVRDEVYGNLYLTDKVGAEGFSDEDEALAEALALATGVAIQNHRLHEQCGRSVFSMTGTVSPGISMTELSSGSTRSG